MLRIVLTLGVDLAAQPKNTAWCAIQWTGGAANTVDMDRGASDATLLQLFADSARVGIDVPLGWPDDFVQAVADHREGRPWSRADSKRLRFRETDRFVHERTRRWPLSVSSDRIGITAMRAARLLSAWTGGTSFDRVSDSRIAEVYPAAALRMWGLAANGYKGPKAKHRDSRCKLLSAILDAAPWLSLAPRHAEECAASDDSLDALIAALTARAAARDLCLPVPHDSVDAGHREGWIHLPLPDSLPVLAD